MPNWPADLPFFSARSGYQLSGPTGHILRYKPDVGPPQRRLRTSAARRPFSGKIGYLTVAQLAQFEEFYRTALGNGVLSFSATDPVTGKPHTYCFAGEYKITPNKLGVSVAAELEILP
ncbi:MULTISPECIES: hypothetical protein [unclassified Salipiger]|uniref:hypothetical protein n=1 Tax=unclassified Salipiger TaxID=2640570 RepID=UPI0013B9CBD3|nr:MULTISPECIES: hypothetical protein [unclassified Salipiger]NDV51550.1 hypothetical protein [Salipiger sp. PrR003]NDW35190.1 hypothetical protein [Salipiger sp. PrR007]